MTLVTFQLIKEGIKELMEDRLLVSKVDLATSQLGAHILSNKDFKGCEALDFFGGKDPIPA